MQITILFHTRTGTTRKVAELIREGILHTGACTVELMEVEGADKAILAQSQAVIFGSPVYSASFAWPLKRWFDEEARDCSLAGKLAANFATGAYIGGGDSEALSSMASHELVRGMLVYSGGGPLTHLGATVVDLNDQAQRDRAIQFGERIGTKTRQLFESKGDGQIK